MRIKVGLVGTSQKSFPGKKEETYALLIEQMKENAKEMNFDFVFWKDQVIFEEDARNAVKFMEDEKVDFLMVVNISYSSGFLVPHSAQNLPLLIVPQFGQVQPIC